MSEQTEEQFRRALYEAAAIGQVEIAGERNGETLFRLTAAGNDRVNAVIDSFIAIYGEEAADFLAASLDLPAGLAEELVDHRRLNQ